MNRKLVIVTAVLACLAGAAFVSRRLNANVPSVVAEAVKREAISSTILASGELSFREIVELRPEVIGQVSAVNVQEGERVQAGQILVELDQATYLARVQRQQALVRQQQAAIQGQRANLNGQEKEFTRRRAFHEAGYISQSDFDIQKTNLEIADRELMAREGALGALFAELSQAREDLAKTVIRAPMSGTVTRLNVRPGETVVVGLNITGTSLLQIAGVSDVVAVVFVDEAEIDDVKLGASARVESGADPGVWQEGHVIRIASSVSLDPAHPGRRFRVEIALNTPKQIRDGTSCRAEIVTAARRATPAVPLAAVQFPTEEGSYASDKESNAHVFVLEGNTIRKREVTLGIANDVQQELLEGVRPGEQVVVGPFQVLKHLRDGDKVKLTK